MSNFALITLFLLGIIISFLCLLILLIKLNQHYQEKTALRNLYLNAVFKRFEFTF